MATPSNLPAGVVRDEHCRLDVTLSNCEILRFKIEAEDGRTHFVGVSRRPPEGGYLFRPLETGNRYRDLRPGHAVVMGETQGTVRQVVVYR